MPTKPLPDPIAKVVNKYGDPDAFAERDLELLSDRLQHLPFGTLLYPGDAARLLQDKDAALKEWMDKTEWVQEQKSTFPVKTVGLHRADVLREEIQRLRAVLYSVPVPSGSRYNFLIGDDGEYQVMDSKGQQVGTILYYQDAKYIADTLASNQTLKKFPVLDIKDPVFKSWCSRNGLWAVTSDLKTFNEAAEVGASRAVMGRINTVTLNGYQLKEALEYLNPDGPLDPDQLEGELTFGVVQHEYDDHGVALGMCCWSDDDDGVYPLDGIVLPEQPAFTTDTARAYLLKYMNNQFSDTTFTHYIQHLMAGDFAYQLATALSRNYPLTQTPPTAGQDVQTAFFAWFADQGAGHAGYKEAQDVFVAGYHASQKGGVILQARSPEQTSWEDVTKEVYDHALANGFEVRTLKLEVL